MRPSVVVLVLANLAPLPGVLFWGWSVFEIVLLYWVENVFIGAINVLKMIVASPDGATMDRKLSGFEEKISKKAEGLEDPEEVEAAEFYRSKIEDHAETIGKAHHAAKFFMVPFFCVHYGIFCLGHGLFILVLLGGGGGLPGGGFHGEIVRRLFGEVVNGPIFLSAVALGGSHLFSFFANFLGRGEFRKKAAPGLMAQPYGRIMVLHIAILFGAFAIMLLGSPVILLLILIGGKIWLDVKLHLRERRKNAAGNVSRRGAARTSRVYE